MIKFFHIKDKVARLEPLAEDICVSYIGARFQRERETLRGTGRVGCCGYTEHGCFQCDGTNTQCNSYSSYNSLVGGQIR